MRQGVDLCAADSFGRIGARRQMAMDREEDAMRVLVADRGERADDIVGARGEKPAAEAQRKRLRVRTAKRLARRKHHGGAGKKVRAGDAPPRHPLARIALRGGEPEHRLFRAGAYLRVSGDVEDIGPNRHDVGKSRALERLRVEPAHVVQLIAHVRQSRRVAALALRQRDHRQRVCGLCRLAIPQ
jgi:hypothetical protein